MDTKLRKKLQAAAETHIGVLLEENFEEMIDAMTEAYQRHDLDAGGKFHYDIGMRIRLTPAGSEFAVSVKCAWGSRIQVESVPQVVSGQADLFEKKEAAKEEEASNAK